MKIINIDVNDEIIFNTIEDFDTGVITGISSVVQLPTGNYNNILLNFKFFNEKLCEELNMFANFKRQNCKCIDVEIKKIVVKDRVFNCACYVPPEIFTTPRNFTLGIYGFALEDENCLKERVSLVPSRNIVVQGSYDPNETENITPSPTVFEIYFDKIKKATNDLEELEKNTENTLKDLESNTKNTLQELEDNTQKSLEKMQDDFEKEIEDNIKQKINYNRKYETTYITTSTNETVIPINIEQFNDTTVLFVNINGLDLSETIDYTIDYANKNITLTNPLEKIGTKINFTCLKSTIANASDYDKLKGDKGDKGDKGESGTDGVTPIKGTDYFTESEVLEFTNTITTNVNNNIGLAIDEVNGEVI